MTAAAVRLSVVHHWPGTGRPRVSIKRRRLRSAILEAVVDHIAMIFSFTAIVVVVTTEETGDNITLPTGGAAIDGFAVIKRIKTVLCVWKKSYAYRTTTVVENQCEIL